MASCHFGRRPGDRAEFGAQLWIDGDNRECLITTLLPSRARDQRCQFRAGPKSIRYQRQASTLSYYAGIGWDAAPAGPGETARNARLYQTARQRETAAALRPLYLALRPQGSSIGWLREQSHLVDDKAVVDGIACVKFQRLFKPEGRFAERREEACWVSPAREDAVVHWTIGDKSAGSVKYKKDAKWGWIPSEWSVEGQGDGVYEYRVTCNDCVINGFIDPAVFFAGSSSARYSGRRPIGRRLRQSRPFLCLVDEAVPATISVDRRIRSTLHSPREMTSLTSVSTIDWLTTTASENHLRRGGRQAL